MKSSYLAKKSELGVEVGYGEDMRKREERKENKEIQTKNIVLWCCVIVLC